MRLLSLALACLLLHGCVWLRLLEVKGQLQEFDRYVDAVGEPGLELRFREPVLESGDLDHLIQGRATSTTLSGIREIRAYVFRKLAPERAEPESAVLTLVVVCTIEDDRLSAVAFPDEVFRAIPRDLAIAGLKALGRATVDRATRSATGSLTARELADQRPTRQRLVALFGEPNQIRREPDQPRERWLWRYQLLGESLKDDGKPVVAAIGFTFVDGDERPVRFQVSLAGLWGYLDLPRGGDAVTAAGSASAAVEP